MAVNGHLWSSDPWCIRFKCPILTRTPSGLLTDWDKLATNIMALNPMLSQYWAFSCNITLIRWSSPDNIAGMFIGIYKWNILALNPMLSQYWAFSFNITLIRWSCPDNTAGMFIGIYKWEASKLKPHVPIACTSIKTTLLQLWNISWVNHLPLANVLQPEAWWCEICSIQLLTSLALYKWMTL